jgi:hypothetical protein
MATRSLKARVELDGEKQYKQALSELNQGNKVLASEMQKLQAEYKNNTESTEFLTKKGELLQRQLLQQKDKVETLRAALQNAAEKYGEADKRTQNWIIQLNNAEAAQYDLEHSIEENDKALQSETKTMVGLGDTVDDLASKLGIQIPDGAKKALNGMEGFSAGTVAAMGAAAAGVAVLMKAVSELHQMTLEAGEWADGLLTRASQTGLDAETLQGMDYASNFLDFDGIDQSLVRLTESMDKAREGAEAQSAAFEMLGVSVTNTDGTLRSNWETFKDVIDSLGEIENATERDVVANELFGKSYSELKPLIDAGTDTLQEYMDTAKENGIVLTESQIKILGEVDDAHQELQATIDATKRQLAAEFAPASKQAMETFAKAVKLGGDTLEETGIVRNTAALIENILGVVDAGMDMIDALPSWMNPLETVSGAMKGLAVVAATVADSMSLVASLMTLDFHGAATALGMNLQKGEMSHLQQLKYSDPKYVSYNAAGTDNWRGGLTCVGEAGPELVSLPRGSQIYSNQESRSMAGVTIGTVVIEARTIRELNDLVRIFQGAQIEGRMS